MDDDDDNDDDFVLTVPKAIEVKVEPNNNSIDELNGDFGELNHSAEGMNETTSNGNNTISISNRNHTDNINENHSCNGTSDNQHSAHSIRSIYDNVAGYLNFTVDVNIYFAVFQHNYENTMLYVFYRKNSIDISHQPMLQSLTPSGFY